MLNEYDIDDITQLFYRKINKNIDCKAVKNEVKNMFVDKEEPKHIIERFYDAFVNTSNFDVANFNQMLEVLSEKNLIMRERFYYHPALQHSNNRVKLKQDENGYFVEEDCDFFYIRNYKYFDLDDVLEYYYKKFKPRVEYRKRDIAVVDKLYDLCFCDLDWVLYVVDIAHEAFLENKMRPPDSPVFLYSHIENAKNLLESRVNICKQNNIDREICMMI